MTTTTESSYYSGMTAWSYKPDRGPRWDDPSPISADGRTVTHASGLSPVTDAEVSFELTRYGHVILTNDHVPGGRMVRSSNHHMIGVGVGHDDAEFAENGRSMAVFYESGEAFRGETWWTDPADVKLSPIRAYYDCRHLDFRRKTGRVWA